MPHEIRRRGCPVPGPFDQSRRTHRGPIEVGRPEERQWRLLRLDDAAVAKPHERGVLLLRRRSMVPGDADSRA